ncbi:MAG: DNA polymerase III subunit alpha [Patescibacteria group bacterium]
MTQFAHLHTHTHYSLLDGLPKVKDLIAAVKKQEGTAVAITDHGVMYGAIEFYKAAKAAGIKPIIGMEAYVAMGDLEEKKTGVDDDYYHLTLLAENMEGYRNLMKLTTVAHLEGFYYKPRIDKKTLRKFHSGIIALSGCLRGEVPRYFLHGRPEKAKESFFEYLDIFGKDNFFIEVQHHPELPDQIRLNQFLKELSDETGVPCVATVDSHYIEPKDGEAQDILVCVQTGKLRSDTNRLDMRHTDLSLRHPDAVRAALEKDFPGAVENTMRIADRCNVELQLGKWLFPKFETPGGIDSAVYLEKCAFEGLRRKFGEVSPPELEERLRYELGIINSKGYPTYFLVVADYVNWARQQGIVCTTRGSAAGSFVSYCIGITTVDPLRFNLPFERFLNPFRPSPPDIDMDFADNRRDEVLEYVRNKYGRDQVGQIVTFGTLLARAAVRDVVRVLGLPYSVGDKLSKMIPLGAQGSPMTVEKAMDLNPELKQMYHDSAETKEVLELARSIEGCVRHASVHAAGVVISPTPLTDYTPLQREPGGENIITQYEMHAIEDAGVLKMDFLGVRNLSILGDAVKIVKKTKEITVDLINLAFDDKETYELLARGETMGVFQLSGSGMTRYLTELKPTTIHDIMAMVALFRPGPMESIPEYIRRKHNPSLVEYLDPRMEEILKESYGVITYQDDVLLLAIKLAGYTWEGADKLRKAIGKKIKAEMMAQEEKFKDGCVANGMTKAKSNELWKLIEPFAAYGFNKAHAVAYAVVAYHTAYMKAHFPAEFMTAVLSAESGDNEKIAEVISACRSMGIEVLPPNVNESLSGFTYVNDKQIRFGLLTIKNLGGDVIDGIIVEREQGGAFASLEDFLARIKNKSINKKSLESLVKSGAMDQFGDRGVLLENMDTLLAYHKEIVDSIGRKQASLFAVAAAPGASSHPRLLLKPAPSATADTKLQWEKELLGLYISSHPFEKFKDCLDISITPCKSLGEDCEGQAKTIAGIVTLCKKFTTKSGDQMAVIQIEDLTGSCEVVAFPKMYAGSAGFWQDGAPLRVAGKFSMQEGKKRMVCDRVEALSQKREDLPRRIVISLRDPDPALMQGIREYLASARGNVPVYLRVAAGTETRTIETDFFATHEESTVRALEALTGQGSVTVV